MKCVEINSAQCRATYISFTLSHFLFQDILNISFLPHPSFWCELVDLLLLVDAIFSGAAVYEQQETANNREDLEEIVLGEVLVGMVLMELQPIS